jgi:hypothetical protein
MRQLRRADGSDARRWTMKPTKKHMVLALLLRFIPAGSALMAASEPKAITILQPDSPIEITSYKAQFHNGGTAGYPTEGIEHRLEYKNRGTQKVVAISFGLLAFDVFNRFLGTVDGIAMREVLPGKAASASPFHSPYAAFSFLTGLAYVNLVRFEDGTLWRADEATVLAEVRKIEKDFDSKLLKEKEGPGR